MSTMSDAYFWCGMQITDGAVHDSLVDVLAYALDELRRTAEQKRGSLDGLQTVILPPDGHAVGSYARKTRQWTVALTENPTDLTRRLAGAVHVVESSSTTEGVRS